MEGSAQKRLRIDKWLWQARFFKTRSLAAKQVGAGHVRVNGNRVSKPAHAVGPGDVLTFAQARRVRVVRIEALGDRRGPAPEAQTLYTDLAGDRDDPPANPSYEGKGRPTGRERRKFDLSRRTMPD
ncbi:RNA-binding S4 domain-containing protein [Pukyongiella litopenaei]|uniref:RNA-binding S4 domain-containing protein n=1 Tax=Pukyongiella litopenaei TaxID=2605946 RepID=A0A2S0MKY2_9RHOB|nr:RNA-binding S4 domain-containing protein [Pukyongiella litopenaei]AVO36421.1 RNA-binding S4 domain-containing protein [Pukyongiella litopenaei]